MVSLRGNNRFLKSVEITWSAVFKKSFRALFVSICWEKELTKWSNSNSKLLCDTSSQKKRWKHFIIVINLRFNDQNSRFWLFSFFLKCTFNVLSFKKINQNEKLFMFSNKIVKSYTIFFQKMIQIFVSYMIFKFVLKMKLQTQILFWNDSSLF